VNPLRTSRDLARVPVLHDVRWARSRHRGLRPEATSPSVGSIYLANSPKLFLGRLSVQLLLVRPPIGEMVFVATLAATRENRGKLMVTDFVTYLSFDGRCEEAFKRYEKVFKGKIAMMMRTRLRVPVFGRIPKRPIASCMQGLRSAAAYSWEETRQRIPRRDLRVSA
jgi:hypothetical protein